MLVVLFAAGLINAFFYFGSDWFDIGFSFGCTGGCPSTSIWYVNKLEIFVCAPLCLHVLKSIEYRKVQGKSYSIFFYFVVSIELWMILWFLLHFNEICWIIFFILRTWPEIGNVCVCLSPRFLSPETSWNIWQMTVSGPDGTVRAMWTTRKPSWCCIWLRLCKTIFLEIKFLWIY